MLQFCNILYCRWKNTSDNGQFIVEIHDFRSLRVKYLRAIKACRGERSPFVYADDTYIHTSHTTSHAWDDRSEADLTAFISKGRVLISSMLVIVRSIHCTEHMHLTVHITVS